MVVLVFLIIRMKTLTPFGLSDFVPEETEAFQSRLQTVKNVFDNQDYQTVKTPTLEYYDTLSVAMGDFLKERAIKIVDRSGHLMILRTLSRKLINETCHPVYIVRWKIAE